MSSHTLDLSGQRQLAITLNDPAVTKAWAPAKAGDDVEVSVGAREVRVALHTDVRVQRRLVTVSKQVLDEDRRPVKNEDGEYVYEPVQQERLVLVLGPSASLFLRASLTPDQRALPDGAEGKPTHEQHPHTSVVAKRRGDDEWHYLEAGELVEELSLADLLRSPDVG